MTTRWKNVTNRRNWKHKTLYLIIYLFNVYPICINHVFKTYYSVFNNCTKSFSINLKNMTWYAFFQFRNSLYVSSVDIVLKKSHNQKSQRFKSGNRESNAIRKPLEISRSSSKWARSTAVNCRAIWGDTSSFIESLSTVVDAKREWCTVEGDRNSVNSWWNTSGNLEKCFAQRKKYQN